MIPFENTWPYERMGEDIYFASCPFCETDDVLLPLKQNHLTEIRSGAKLLLVVPCCHSSMKVIDADEDYLLANVKLRKRQQDS